jgi:hypothetical protein
LPSRLTFVAREFEKAPLRVAQEVSHRLQVLHAVADCLDDHQNGNAQQQHSNAPEASPMPAPPSSCHRLRANEGPALRVALPFEDGAARRKNFLVLLHDEVVLTSTSEELRMTFMT